MLTWKQTPLCSMGLPYSLVAVHRIANVDCHPMHTSLVWKGSNLFRSIWGLLSWYASAVRQTELLGERMGYIIWE